MRTAAPESLAPWAVTESNSRGRRAPEDPPQHRTEFQRDRDRVLHSAAFRRLEYKTQVFVNHEGDMFRTRLTHSLEVAQIARTIAGALKLNEALVEAIAIAHDLGHTPFGHAGQHALNACMREHGGFEHNLQSLRVVDVLEDRYVAFRGLNLTYETREGILKHCRRDTARELGELGKRFLDGGQASLEAQIANLADEIAYNNHDIDDGLRSGLITLEQVSELPIFSRHIEQLRKQWPRITDKQLCAESIRAVINEEVDDLISTTRQTLEHLSITQLEQVRECRNPIVGFSAQTARAHSDIKRFLRRALYRHPQVLESTRAAEKTVTELFQCYLTQTDLLPADVLEHSDNIERAVADYVAGMTDRFALAQHARLLQRA